MTGPSTPPAFGAPSGGRPPGTAERLVSWLLYAGSVLFVAVLALFSFFGVMATDSCGVTDDDPRVCDGDYLASVMVGYWAWLAFVVFAVGLALVVAMLRRRRAWPYPVVGIVALIVGTATFVYLMSR